MKLKYYKYLRTTEHFRGAHIHSSDRRVCNWTRIAFSVYSANSMAMITEPCRVSTGISIVKRGSWEYKVRHITLNRHKSISKH